MEHERRSFLTHLRGGAAALALAGAADAQVKPGAHFEPALHDQDNWLDQVTGKHRVVFDVTKAEGLGEAILFASNYFAVNRNEYKMENRDLSVLVIVRHRAAAFGYNDAMWNKYGVPLSLRAQFVDPKTKDSLKTNFYNASTNGVSWPALASQGAQLGVCASATHGFASVIAEATGGKADVIFNELTSNLVGSARMVPAGIITITRAQERGYSLVST